MTKKNTNQIERVRHSLVAGSVIYSRSAPIDH
jgi:hypothetical protein